MKPTLRRALARVAPQAAAGGVRVLLYHSIDEPDPLDTLSLRVSRARFLEQMRLLQAEGYAVVPLTSVFQATGPRGRPRLAITFDDGYRSVMWAATTLRVLGFPATFFVVPRFLDGVRSPAAYWERWEHLRWEEAAALIADGFDIGAHSTTHPDLRQCDSEQLEQEVSGARALLQERLKTDIVSFSYPYGRHDRRVRRAVERAGYQLACTSRYGLNRSSGRSYSVHRTEIAGTDTLQDFLWKVRGKYDWFGRWQDVRATR